MQDPPAAKEPCTQGDQTLGHQMANLNVVQWSDSKQAKDRMGNVCED